MKRAQLYLDDDLWRMLHERARAQRTTISALVGETLREQFTARLEQRRRAMEAVVGMRKRRS